jgi:hypothetical protein
MTQHVGPARTERERLLYERIDELEREIQRTRWAISVEAKSLMRYLDDAADGCPICGMFDTPHAHVPTMPCGRLGAALRRESHEPR